MAVPEASTVTKYPLPPSHISQQPRRSSMDDLTKRVFPVLKGDTKASQCQEVHSYRSLEKRWGSKSSGNAGGGGRKYWEVDTDGDGRNATSGDSGGRSSGGGDSSAPLKHDPLLQYKIPKLNTTGTVVKGRHAPQSLKKDVITSASQTIHTFDCTAFERDYNPNDPLIQSVATHPPKTEMKLQDMSNNCVILTPSLSPKQSHSVPSFSASSRCKSPTLTQKSLDDCTSNPKELIRRALDVYFDEGTITNRQYKRILERATRKVEEGLAMSSYMNENRVKKLVSDFVEAYKYHGTWS